jgi:radical SAM superfamily enzyme YgiQ (UPF0313 family)
MTPIKLATINAKYMHASLGLRYLYANLGDLREQCRIAEFTINERAVDIVEHLLADAPRIIGLGVYIWNAVISTEVVKLIKVLRPETVVVLGGPEVSYEQDRQPIVQYADYVIPGMADLAFARLCGRVLDGYAPAPGVIEPGDLDICDLQMPYRWYTAEDIDRRLIYVEASRGCPFKCEFCLSALDRTAWPFDLEQFLDEMRDLHERGARHFKFVDRTFNLKTSSTVRILEFFLERTSDDLFLHFELIPDRLPDALKSRVVRFPPGSLQFEIGVQTFNPEVQDLISRRQDNEKTLQNLRWLRAKTCAHLHADLIFGLPGESLETFRDSFDRLVAADPHEIQVGILKRLRGSPIIRHTGACGLRFNPDPPYNILATDRIDFPTMQAMNRFARYWDLIINSGRFQAARPLLLGDAPFDNFLTLSGWLYQTTGQTHRIALNRLFHLLRRGACGVLGVSAADIDTALDRDYARARDAKQRSRHHPPGQNARHTKRQSRHLNAEQGLYHEH